MTDILKHKLNGKFYCEIPETDLYTLYNNPIETPVLNNKGKETPFLIRIKMEDDYDIQPDWLGEYKSNTKSINFPYVDRNGPYLVLDTHEEVTVFTIEEANALEEFVIETREETEAEMQEYSYGYINQEGEYEEGEEEDATHVEIYFYSLILIDIAGKSKGRGEYEYFKPASENYKGCSQEELIQYCEQDYKRMSDFGDGWYFVGLVASLMFEGQELSTASIWGIESDYDNAPQEYIPDLIWELGQDIDREITNLKYTLHNLEQLT